MRAPPRALAALEIPVRGRGAALARQQAVGVHRQTHRTARPAPLETRLDKHPIQPLALGLLAHQTGTGHRQRLFDVGGNFPPLQHIRRRAQILDTRIGAGTDENLVHRNRIDRHVGIQPHVLQGTLDGLALDRIAFPGRVGHLAADGNHHFRRSSPRHLRLDILAAQLDHVVEMRPLVAVQRPPVGNGSVPLRAPWREIASSDVIDRHFIDADEAHARARLDRHVAQGHASLHRQAAHRAAAELDGVSRAARRANAADHRQRDVLGRHAPAQPAIDADQQRLRLLLQQTLRRQHMLDFRRADAQRHAAERPVRAGV